MSEVKRFTRTCDCVTEVPHGEYVLYSDYDALAQQLAAAETRATVNAQDCNEAERKLASRDKQLTELKQAFSESQEEVVSRGKLLADAVGLFIRVQQQAYLLDVSFGFPLDGDIDAFLATIEQDKVNEPPQNS